MAKAKTLDEQITAPPPEDGGDIVPYDEGGQAVTGGGIGTAPSWNAEPDFSSEEVTMARLRLAQGLTAEVQDGKARPGQWVVTGFSAQDTVRFVPLLFGRTRAFQLDRDHPVTCQSGDAFRGHGEFGQGSKVNPTGLCGSCPHSQWTPNPKKPGKNSPPACPITYRYVGFSVTHGILCELALSRTSQGAAKEINSAIQRVKLGNFAIVLGSENHSEGQRKWTTPTIQVIRPHPDVLQRARDAILGGSVDAEFETSEPADPEQPAPTVGLGDEPF